VERRQPALDLLGEDRPMSATRRALALLVPVLLALAGCSSSTSSGTSRAASDAPSVTATSTPPAPAPRVGSCHALSVSQATEPVDAGAPVPCRRTHTSVTVKVGQFSPVADGHLLAVDSRTVRAEISKSCPPQPTAFLGGTLTDRRLSRFQVVWFSPSLEQGDAGATWYRCDVVALRTAGQLLPLPARVKDVLSQPGALDRFGTCGTAAPDARGFARVVCSERHSWRAVDVVDLPVDARYLAKDVAARGDAACKDIAAGRADGALKYTWSFEWPTRAQWQSGQRYGYCWVPET
jgi:hypothetical protein